MKDLFELKDKVIAITGASGLLGKQHANAIAQYGGIPVLLDLDKQKLEAQKLEIQQTFNVECGAYVLDITHEESVIQITKEIIGNFGKLDGLINNAANNPKVEDSETTNFSRLENFPTQVWNQDIAVGLTGAFLCAKHMGFEISKNPNGGSIINISSDLGLIAPDQRLYKKEGIDAHKQPVKPVTYSVVKTGIIGLTRYLATYWADANVRCNAICPGGVENNQNEDFLKEVTSRIPLGRMAKADEYKGLIVFLLSDSAAYLNGSVIAADGGRTAW